MWGAKAILHEALSLQSLLALLVREEGLSADPSQTLDWDTWIRFEASTRTKLIAYCFFNLCSIAYNTPPLLLTSEVNLFLPNPSRLWRAETAWQWQEVRQSYPNIEIALQDAFSRLLNRPSQGPPTPLSSLGNYVLIHALIQHIYLLKQTSFSSLSPFEVHRGLKVEDIEEVSQALRVWTIGFEQHRQLRANEAGQHGANLDSSFGGPVAFDSTALLRLAYIRLYTDLSPSRSLETRDSLRIATAFNDAPMLVRSPHLHRAVLQAIHALSMLVKMGVNYVARTKSLEWSMQHSRKFFFLSYAASLPNISRVVLFSGFLPPITRSHVICHRINYWQSCCVTLVPCFPLPCTKLTVNGDQCAILNVPWSCPSGS